jgi:undecaprenol kinase
MRTLKQLKNQSLLQRLKNAIAGIWYGLTTEHSLRLHASALVLLLIALIVLRPGAIWTALVLLAAGGVIAAELLNTAVEALSDLVQPEEHPQIRIVKDCAAGAVLIASMTGLCVGIALVVHLLT